MWAWIGAGGLLGVVVLAMLLAISGLGRAAASVQAPTPVVTVLTNPTPTPSRTPTATRIEPTALPPTPTPDPSAGQGIAVGDYVEVYGTGGDGLRIRAAAGLSAPVQFLALENEVFEVRGGPEEVDDRVWWFLANPNDPTKNGWAVAEYLRRIGAR